MAVGAIQQQGEGAVLGKPLETAAAWTAADVLAEPLRWRYELTASDVQEVLAATKHAVATGKPVLVRARSAQAGPAMASPAAVSGGALFCCCGAHWPARVCAGQCTPPALPFPALPAPIP